MRKTVWIYAVDGWSAKGVHKNVETRSRISSRWTIWLLSDVNPKILFQKCNLKLCITILIEEINNLWWTFWTCFSNLIYFLSALTFSTLKPCFSSYLIYLSSSQSGPCISTVFIYLILIFILVYLNFVNLHILIIREKIFNFYILLCWQFISNFVYLLFRFIQIIIWKNIFDKFLITF